ncbi:hypothetical protein [Mycolicibacterium fluoranthenivorans]|uniref:Uncharacterized protein n=1 Tax=Mycolicibacterium fluoranthenivorans TaxID=258505 RepID=A0A1G4WYR3_9MYCO|nr:hypothetical protein [Mycolicibacterium fluoranthenivorans]SCX31480.1 hypothetical protein SAMN02799620_05357 [Mycolicibacterium fluoranthenivorans]
MRGKLARHGTVGLPCWLLVDDETQPPTVAQSRERSERARTRARARHRDRLTDVLSRRGVDEADAVADVVLDALTEWRYIDSGARCTCSCHPQLPDSDRHDYGFDCICTCTRTLEQRRNRFQRALDELRDLWQSPDGEQARNASLAAETELQRWLTEHPGVAINSHGGSAPEQWRGNVDGHSFYFRERHDDWHIEIDLRPTGQFIEVLDGHTIDGRTQTRKQAVKQGDVIATGTIDAEDYGTTVVQRAQFIVTIIRDHLKRKSCTHHADKLDAITAAIGTTLDWCPTCGIRLAAG